MARVSSPVFVGRAAELQWLLDGLEEAGRGRPVTRLVAGEAGIGKTRLVGEFMTSARDGAQVLIGDCLQLGATGLPYAPFVGALRPLLRSLPRERLDELIGPGRGELAHLMPDLGPPARRAPTRDGPVAAGSTQARLFEIILGLLRRLADERPVVLVLEDIHWADSSTRDLTRFLVRNGREGRLMYVATYRSDELHRRHPLRPLVAELQRLESVDDVELAAFAEEEMAEQLAGITGEPVAPSIVSAVFARSGGNPFFAEELIAAGEVGLALPRSLRDTLDDRVRQVGEDAQHVLRVASVSGPSVDHRILARVAGLDEARLTQGIREVVETHLLIPASPTEAPGYRFRHELLREVVYEELLPSERTQLHAAYAQAIESDPGLAHADPSGTTAQLAHHWHMAHDIERALPAALAAARAAAAGFAFAEAQAFLERALELWPKVPVDRLPPGVDRTVLLEEAAEVAAQAGDPRRSIDFIRSALAETDALKDPRRVGALHHRLSWYFNEAGDWQSGAAAMERAVELIPIDPPSQERASVLAELSHSLMIQGRYAESLVLGEAALAIARATGARVAEARALNAIGLDLASRSDLERGLPLLREGSALAAELEDPLAIFLSAVGLSWTLDESARHLEALEVSRTALERIRRLGADARFGGNLQSKVAHALIELGRWTEARALLDETIAAGTTRYALRWLLTNRIHVLTYQGEIERARADLLSYEALGEHVVGPDPDLLHALRAEMALVAGDPATARTLVDEVLERYAEPELDVDARKLVLLGLRADAYAAELARASSDPSAAAEASEHAQQLAARMRRSAVRIAGMVPHPATVIEADLVFADALASRARGEADVELWEQTVALRRRLDRPFELAVTLAWSAVVQLDARRREAGAAALTEAHTLSSEVGARPLREWLEALARRARISVEGVDSAQDAADRLGLTKREREVLALLADGRSNRQIGEQLYMAESTAGVHVSNILSKLGVTRRSEAAALAHRLGLFQSS
ncbi:MAG TPA: AAA family ATPase [Candidatus Limnocylindria bacterium]|nr:AAA family ATPase [Candidatus Limnocylindria bacterium]